MSIGRMTDRVWVIELTDSYPDGMGGRHRNKVKAKECWCAVTEQPEGRAGAMHNEETTQQAEFLIRAGAYKVTVKHLLEYNGQEYTIHSVTEDYKHRTQTIIGYAKA